MLWLRDSFIRSRSLNATRIVTGSLAAIILIGVLLLTLPIASWDGWSAGFFIELSTAISPICVTGLILVDTRIQWTLFGQAVILTMIQLGGLGFMTIITLVSFALHRRVGLSEWLITVSIPNLNDMDGMVWVVRYALVGTFAMEMAGTVLVSVYPIPEFSFLKGTWHAMFHVVSSFCNAGFDPPGGCFGAFSNLADYNDNPLILGTTTALIAVDSLGFFAWEDIADKRCWSRLSAYSKMVLLITTVLIVGNVLFFLMEESDNSAILGGIPLWQKGLNALFRSVILRTAGFDPIGQGSLSDASKAMSRVLILVSGSSGPTTSGPKTATVDVLLLTLRSGLMGREQVTSCGQVVHYCRVLNAMILALVVLLVSVFSSMVMSTMEDLPCLDSAFEVTSAMDTVDLITGITSALIPFSQGLLIPLMYMGCVGILLFSTALITGNRHPAKIKYPEVNIMIG